MNHYGYLEDEKYATALGQRIVFDRLKLETPPPPVPEKPAE